MGGAPWRRGGAPTDGRESFLDAGTIASQGNQTYDLSGFVNPAHPLPPGCNIKGKYAVRARVTGNLGIYHLQACRSYPGLDNPDRWFCSEEDAQAARFRKAFNCRSPAKGK